MTVTNNLLGYENCPHNLTFRWWLADGFSWVQGKKTTVLHHWTSHSLYYKTVEFVLKAGEEVAAVNRCVLEVLVEGRATAVYAPVVYLG